MTAGDAGYRAAQRADLLRFVAAARVDDGFGWAQTTAGVDTSRGTQLWITCRMTHVASLGVIAGEAPRSDGTSLDDLRALAAHGVEALNGPLQDAVHGGWSARLDDGTPTATAKQAYGHAFVILAASSAVAAGIEGAEALLSSALAVSESRFWDESEGLSLEEWDADWTTLDTYRGVNANMHTVEAYLAAGDITHDHRWHERAGRIGARVAQWAAANEWRIPEHFDEQWNPMLEHHRDKPADPFRPYGATVGHGLEWARLLLAIDATLGRSAPEGLVDAARALYAAAVADGWARDGADGFVYTTDWQGEPVVRERMHWVAAEAIGAAQALFAITGEARYSADLSRWWAYVDSFLVDHRGGSWHHELDAHNVPAGTVWPGKSDAYHAYQAALIQDLPLVPSFAAALVAVGGLS
ncbi:MAG: AGE family epimerase/isomerase [Demequina sp.]|uniref:AGE family epimerase/isomerase n=1 Tax=Demequina sp. TaxID=2050685 RepID=UPI003A876D2B